MPAKQLDAIIAIPARRSAPCASCRAIVVDAGLILSRRCRVRLLLSESVARDARRRASSGARHPLVPRAACSSTYAAPYSIKCSVPTGLSIDHPWARIAAVKEASRRASRRMAGGAAAPGAGPSGTVGQELLGGRDAEKFEKPPSTAEIAAAPFVELAAQRPSASEREKRPSMKNGMWVDAMREAMRSSRESKCCAVATRGHGVSRVSTTAATPLQTWCAFSGSSSSSHAYTSRPQVHARPSGLENTPASSASLKAHLWASSGSTAHRLSTAARAPAEYPGMTMSEQS